MENQDLDRLKVEEAEKQFEEFMLFADTYMNCIKADIEAIQDLAKSYGVVLEDKIIFEMALS